MATFAAGYQSRLYVAAFDASAYFNSADVQDQIAKLETTAFGNTAKQYTPGLAEGALKAGGFFSGVVGEVNDVLHAQLGTSAGQACTFYPALDTLGAAAYVFKSRATNLSVKSAVGGMVQTDAEFVADGGVAYGVSLRALAAATSTATSTSVDNSAATSTGWRATLHVTAASGTTPTLDVKLQDSADNSTFADVTGGAFTQATAATSQLLVSAAATTTLRRYVRIVATIAGTTPSFTFACAVARQK